MLNGLCCFNPILRRTSLLSSKFAALRRPLCQSKERPKAIFVQQQAFITFKFVSQLLLSQIVSLLQCFYCCQYLFKSPKKVGATLYFDISFGQVNIFHQRKVQCVVHLKEVRSGSNMGHFLCASAASQLVILLPSRIECEDAFCNKRMLATKD